VDVATLACLLAATLLLLRLHLARTGLSPVRDAVSDYGTTPWHLFYRAMVVALGAAAALLAIQLHSETDAGALVWLWIFAASRIAIAGFMTDRDPPPFTREGRIHFALAAVAFTSIALAATSVDWTGRPGVLGPLGVAVAISAVATAVARFAAPAIFGFVERVLYATSIAWLAIAAINVLG
jgi:hypothetical protein